MSGTPERLFSDRTKLQEFVAARRASGDVIVFSNGAFDLLHVGHVRALEHARRLGGCLIVGINSDSSVRAYKGPGRPVVPEGERAELVAALRCVDAVCIFDEPAPGALIRIVRPDVHAKGRDYSPETVPEGDLVRELGGRVEIVGDPKDHSSTDLIQRVRRIAAP